MTYYTTLINNFFRDNGLDVTEQSEGATTYWVYPYANQFLGWVSLYEQDTETILNISLDIGIINFENDPGIALCLLGINSSLPEGFRVFTTFNEIAGLGFKVNSSAIKEDQIIEHLELIHQIGFRVREVAGSGISPLPQKLLLNAGRAA